MVTGDHQAANSKRVWGAFPFAVDDLQQALAVTAFTALHQQDRPLGGERC